MDLTFRKYSWQLAPASLLDIRRRVFTEEQKVPPELEWDDTDEIADHYLAFDGNNQPIATARLFPTLEEIGHIGRMAVLPEHRGKSIGKALLRHLMAESVGRYSKLALSSQQHATGLYLGSGFHICSEVYQEAGIPHLSMRCLAPELVASDTAHKHTMPLILGEDSESWLFNDQPRMLGLMDSLAGQARQRLWLYDKTLEHDLYDRHQLRELISTLARSHRLSDVRLLVHDDSPLVKRRHQLVELLRRIPSRIELRLVNTDYPAESQPFMLVDREGLLYRHDFNTPEGFASFQGAGRIKLREEAFQRMWDAARPSLELRELPL